LTKSKTGGIQEAQQVTEAQSLPKGVTSIPTTALLKRPRATIMRPQLQGLNIKPDSQRGSLTGMTPNHRATLFSRVQDADKLSVMSGMSRKTGMTKGSRVTQKTFNSKQIMTVQSHKQMELVIKKIEKITTLENFMTEIIDHVVNLDKGSISNEEFNKYLKEKYTGILGLEDRKF
jgi:hypothetical protein